MEPTDLIKEKEKEKVYNSVTKLYNKLFKNYYDELQDAKKDNLEGDEEEGKSLKILTPNTLLTRLPVLLAQIIAENNSCKLKSEIRQILYLLYRHNIFNNVSGRILHFSLQFRF